MAERAVPSLLGSHEGVLSGLWRAAQQGRLPHALLFHGLEGIGKFTAARRLAQGLLCAAGPAAPPCGTCGGCRRVASGNHLDLFVLDVAHEDVPEDKREERIKLDRIVRRDPPAWQGPVIEEFLGLRPADGGWRIVLVREAERLRHSSDEAQNALLKMLEEPGESVLWVLETFRPAALLETVRSRCVPVHLEPPSQEDARGVLRNYGLSDADATRLARWTRNSPGQALALRECGGLALVDLLERVLAGRAAPLETAGAVWQVEGTFPGRTAAARGRARARVVIDLAIGLLADLLRREQGVPSAELAHGDLDLGRATDWDVPALSRTLEELLQARADVERNLDPQALVEAALLWLEPSGVQLGRVS